MLSYRHHFHAGNVADVLKHFCLYEVLNYYKRKDKPFLYLDTHAGAGLYQRQDPRLGENREYAGGMDILFQAASLAAPLAAFAQDMQNWLAQAPAHSVAGSPWIAAQMLRPGDSLRACELHPSDYPQLAANILRLRPRRNLIEQSDGFQSLIAALPPPQHRAVVLIDPPYEDKNDCQRLEHSLKKAFARFPQACILVWYPLLSHQGTHQLIHSLPVLAQHYQLDYLQATHCVCAPGDKGFGMYGSAMMIYNPPYTLSQILADCAADLKQHFAQDADADFILQSHSR